MMDAGSTAAGRPLFNLQVAAIVALGGLLMGFDASVISGVIGFVGEEFALDRLQLGWAVASLTLSASLAMLLAGPLSDRLGRRPVLALAAALFLLSALLSAFAWSFASLVWARMLGGLGVGAALIIAPMYIAEIAPPRQRGGLVSFNQLNIVIGISLAFFSNWFLLQLANSGWPPASVLHLDTAPWRWMLGVEALPAVVYLFALIAVPESPRWLAMQGRDEQARLVLARSMGDEGAQRELAMVREALAREAGHTSRWRELLQRTLRPALLIGLTVAVLQQATGINAVFFYAPMIFEQSGIGTDAAFMQATLVGVVNLVFTIVAMAFIDRLGRRPLLGVGLAGIALCMFLLAGAFAGATYQLDVVPVLEGDGPAVVAALEPLAQQVFTSDAAFREAVVARIGEAEFQRHEAQLIGAAIDIDAALILIAILGFVASFAVSIGPVTWVLFSELFPNRIRGLAVSLVGLVNSTVSFLVQLLFPWELATLGSASTFALYGVFALAGLLVLARILPETRGRSLEEVSAVLQRT